MGNVGLRKGIAINFVSRYSNILIQIIITSILARLLTPKEFGIVAVVTVFTTFFSLLGDMGVGPAIIQDKTLSKKELSDIFIFTFFVAIVSSICFYMFSHFIVYFYNDVVYLTIGKLLCINILFSALSIVPNAILFKDKQFKIVGIISISVNCISGLITIILAFKGFSYYSLVLNSIIQSMLMFLFKFYFSKLKLNLSFNISTIKKIANYSIYQFLFNIVNYFSRNLDNIFIGKFMGGTALGYYDKAYKLMLYPVQNLTFVVTPVLQPILSDYQDNIDIIYDKYKNILKILSLIGIFISIFCFFSSKEIILIMYGEQWIGSVIIFKILSLSIAIQMILSSVGAIYQSTGYVDKLFFTGVLSAVFMVVSIIIGVKSGLMQYVAIALDIAFLISFLINYYVLITKVFRKKFISFIMIFKSNVIIIVIMILCYYLFRKNIDNIFISMIYKLVILTVSYIIGLLITKEHKLILKLVKK